MSEDKKHEHPEHPVTDEPNTQPLNDPQPTEPPPADESDPENPGE